MPHAPEQPQHNMRVWRTDPKDSHTGPALGMSIRARATVCQRREELQQRVPDAAHGSAKEPPSEEGSLRALQEARWVAKALASPYVQFLRTRPTAASDLFSHGCSKGQALDKLSWVSSTVMPAQYQSPQIQFACRALAGVLWQHWICGCDEKILGASLRHPAAVHIKRVCRILCTVDYYLCAKVSPRLVWWRRCVWASVVQLACVKEYVHVWVYINIHLCEYLCIHVQNLWIPLTRQLSDAKLIRASLEELTEEISLVCTEHRILKSSLANAIKRKSRAGLYNNIISPLFFCCCYFFPQPIKVCCNYHAIQHDCDGLAQLWIENRKIRIWMKLDNWLK